MTTTRRTLSSLAVLALSAGLMAGCGDEDDPSPTVGSEATETAPVEQSDGGGANADADRPNVPKPDPADYPGMDEHTQEGAEQAFKYFWALVVWGHETGDSTSIQGLYTSDCTLCTTLESDIERLSKNSTQWTATKIDDGELYSEKNRSGYDYVVSYSFTMAAHEEPVAGNPKTNKVDDTDVFAVGGMDWREDGWVIGEINSDVGD